MIRPIATELLLFLTPFVAYAVFLWATRAGVFDPASWPISRLLWLSAIAFVLIIVSFVLFAQFGGGGPESTYVPARLEGGRVVPGDLR